jgi:WD40 repeat protein
VVSAGADGRVSVLSARGGRMDLHASLATGGDAPSRCVRVWPGGGRAAVAGGPLNSVLLLDAEAGATVGNIVGHLARVSHVAIEPTCRGLVTADELGVLKLWDLRATRAAAGRVQPAAGGVTSLLYRPDDHLALAAGRDCAVHLWDLRNAAQPLWSITGHEDWVGDMALTRAGGRLHLLTASADWTARVWQLGHASWSCVLLVGHGAAVTRAAWLEASGGGAAAPLVATGCADGSVGLWDAGGGMLNIAQAHGASVGLVAAAGDDGERLVTAAADNASRVWSVPSLVAAGASADRQPRLLRASGTEHAAMAVATVYDAASLLVCAGHRDGAVSTWRVA